MSTMATGRGQKARSVFGDFILTLLAAAGLICIVLVILGAFFNVSIMMFRTGSMSPTITAGSIALVREIPATEMQVGDVVTVERGSDVLPVTHRVTQIIDTAPDGIVTFEMRGDANETADPIPYSVSTVKRVFFSIPGAAPIIQWLSNAYVLGGLTIGASTLVVWAFWPKKDEEITKDKQNSLVLPAVILAATTTLVPPTADDPDILQLRSYADSETMQNMSPGDSATWVVDAWAETSTHGQITLSLGAVTLENSDAAQIKFSVIGCIVEPFSSLATGCPEDSPILVSAMSSNEIASGAAENFASFETPQRQRLLITGTLTQPVSSQRVSLFVEASGIGEEKQITSEDQNQISLPETGFSKFLFVSIAIALLLSAGMVIVRLSGQKQHAQIK